MQEQPGKVIEQYEISNTVLGQGQFGKVFLGTHVPTGQKVAVKMIDRSKVQGRHLQYLSQQINALKNLHSEYIIKFYDIKKTLNHFYLMMEYCEGGDLNKYITKKGKLSEEEALKFLYQIVRGFRSLVKANLIHRDLKPANIFLKNGQIKIGDFGLAKVLTDDSGNNTFAGSPYNMAPQVLANQQYDSRADIYSIGTVLYQMIYGTHPFYAGNQKDLYEDIKNRRFNCFNRRMVTPQTCTLISKLLAFDADDRMSWQELLNYEFSRACSSRQKLYNTYSSFMDKINTKNVQALPGIFCMINPQWQDTKESNQPSIQFLDIQLNTQILLGLIKHTNFQEPPRDQ